MDAAEEEPRRASGTWDGQPSPTPDGVRAPGGLPPPPPAPHTGSAVAPATARRGDLRPALPGGHGALPGRAFEVAPPTCGTDDPASQQSSLEPQLSYL